MLFILMLLLALHLPVHASEHEHKMFQIDCDFNKGACTKILEKSDLEITLDINPKPLTAMSELKFSVMINKDKSPVSNAGVTLDLTMPGMYMGKNQILLKPAEDYIYEGSGMIPICSSGAKTWIAEVNIKIDDIMHSVSYFFEVR